MVRLVQGNDEAQRGYETTGAHVGRVLSGSTSEQWALALFDTNVSSYNNYYASPDHECGPRRGQVSASLGHWHGKVCGHPRGARQVSQSPPPTLCRSPRFAL